MRRLRLAVIIWGYQLGCQAKPVMDSEQSRVRRDRRGDGTPKNRVILCHFVSFAGWRRFWSRLPFPAVCGHVPTVSSDHTGMNREMNRDLVERVKYMVTRGWRGWKGARVSSNCSGLRGAEWLMGEYGGWVTLGDKSSKSPAPNPLKKVAVAGQPWLKPIYLTKSELLPSVRSAGKSFPVLRTDD